MLVEIETLTSSVGVAGLCASGRRHGRSRGVDQLQLFFTVAPMASSRPPVPQVALDTHSLIAAKLMGKSLPSFSGTSRSTDAWHSHSVAALVREVDETSREAACVQAVAHVAKTFPCCLAIRWHHGTRASVELRGCEPG